MVVATAIHNIRRIVIRVSAGTECRWFDHTVPGGRRQCGSCGCRCGSNAILDFAQGKLCPPPLQVIFLGFAGFDCAHYKGH